MTRKDCTFLTQPSVSYSRIMYFFFACVLPLIVFGRQSKLFLYLVLDDQTFSHAPLVPLISIMLVYLNKEAVFSEVSLNWVLGTPLLSLGFGLLAVLRLNPWQLNPHNQISIFAFGLVLIWVGAFALFFGKQALRAACFPLAFLAFAIPIPEPILSKTIYFLQERSANSTEKFFELLGVPYLRHDLIFQLPGVAIRVADECSGIRSSLALLITTVLACHLFLRGKWQRTLVIAAVVPLAVLKNGLRIATLSVLAIYVDPGFLYGNLHHRGGVVFFAIALIPMGLLLMLLRRSEKRSPTVKHNSRVTAVEIGPTKT